MEEEPNNPEMALKFGPMVVEQVESGNHEGRFLVSLFRSLWVEINDGSGSCGEVDQIDLAHGFFRYGLHPGIPETMAASGSMFLFLGNKGEEYANTS